MTKSISKPVSGAACAVVLLLAGCSTSRVAPDIENFAQATVKATAVLDKTASSKQFTAKRAAARRRSLVAAGAEYIPVSGTDCIFVEPGVNQDPKPFAATCRPVPQDANNQVVVTLFDDPAPLPDNARIAPVLPQDEALLRTYEADQLSKGLADYAKALEELATTNLPSEVGASALKLFEATSALHVAASALAVRESAPPPASPRFSALGKLVSTLASEALEAKRYRLLRDVVEQANPLVRRASIQLATVQFGREKGQLAPKAQAFLLATEQFDANTVRGMARIDAAFDRLVAADRTAKFRVFQSVSTTHQAILDSLNAPASSTELLQANARIEALIKAVQDVENAK